MTRNSVQLISAEHNFAFNLFKSLLILWLFSILVVIVAIFTSTFLSWPIAVVLTLGILLGHWGVDELGDALKPGVGRSVATDLGFGRDVAQSKVVSTSVDALAKLATAVSAVLPDLSKFPVMDDITRGVSIPARHMLDSLEVLAFYGLPMLVLSFIILKNKEVAP
jgi:ABC-type glucose/galactose transport system permease subunit